MRNVMTSSIAMVLTLAAGSAALAHDELIVASDGAGHLHVHEDFIEPLPLDQTFTGFPGMSGVPLGYTTVLADEPGEGLFVLPQGVNIVFVLTGVDAGLTMWDGFDPMTTGMMYPLGEPYFHIHPVWSMDGVPVGEVRQLRGVFRDTTGQFEDSHEVIIDFVIPPPFCAGDLNGDRSVNFADITHALAGFNNPYTFANITEVLAAFNVPCP